MLRVNVSGTRNTQLDSNLRDHCRVGCSSFFCSTRMSVVVGWSVSAGTMSDSRVLPKGGRPKRRRLEGGQVRPIPHNKSGVCELAICRMDDAAYAECLSTFQGATFHPVPGLTINSSQCLLYRTSDGRLTVSQEKKTFAYHVAARMQFGRDSLAAVTAGKSERGAMTISHLCGTRNCCNADHLCLELKSINDERTHCHFVIRQLLERNEVPPERRGDFIQEFMKADFCPHIPRCCHPLTSVPVDGPKSIERGGRNNG